MSVILAVPLDSRESGGIDAGKLLGHLCAAESEGVVAVGDKAHGVFIHSRSDNGAAEAHLTGSHTIAGRQTGSLIQDQMDALGAALRQPGGLPCYRQTGKNAGLQGCILRHERRTAQAGKEPGCPANGKFLCHIG